MDAADKRVTLAIHRYVAEPLLAKLAEKAERGEFELVNIDANLVLLAPRKSSGGTRPR